MEPLKDSASYIAQLGYVFLSIYVLPKLMINFFLERKLERIKKKNESSKVTGKDLIASMAEYKEIYMRNAFKNNIDLNTDYSNQIIDTSYLQVSKFRLYYQNLII